MKHSRITIAVFSILLLSFVLNSSVVFAVEPKETQFSIIENQEDIANCTENKDCFCQVTILVGRITQFLLGLLGSLAFLMFVYGGLMWIMSGGSPDRVTKGKNAIIYSIIGIILALGSYAIVNLILLSLISGATEDKISYKEPAKLFGTQVWSEVQCKAKPLPETKTQKKCNEVFGICKTPQPPEGGGAGLLPACGPTEKADTTAVCTGGATCCVPDVEIDDTAFPEAATAPVADDEGDSDFDVFD